MKILSKIVLTFAATALFVAVPQTAWAVEDQPQNIIIVELQTGSLNTGTEEFVEIYNPNGSEITVTGWLLQYRSAASTGSWTTKRKLACVPEGIDCNVAIAAHGRLVLASYDIATLADEQPMTGGFADAGGQIRLVNPGATSATDDDVVQDMLSYGTAVESEGGLAAPAPPAGKSLKRLVSEDGYYVDTNVNGADFMVGCSDPTPGEIEEPLAILPSTCEEPDDSPTIPEDPPDDTPDMPLPPDSDPTSEDPVDEELEGGMGAGPVEYLPILITELLPDPAPPAQDATDEFIEVFNPNAEPVNLKGYQIQSGSNYRYKYELPDLVIEPGQYLAISSAESGLTLSNGGTQVRILSPDGQVFDELADYGKAVEGQSWSKAADGQWRWSTTPTPGLVNEVTVPPPKATAKSATAKKASTKTAAKPKVASASKAQTSEQEEAFEEPPAPPPNYWLLAGVGSMAVGYGLYEYRQSIAGGARKLWQAVRGGGAAN